MYALFQFLQALNAIYERRPTYRTGGTGKDGTCDCVGAIMGAMYALGHKKYPLHSSNYFARYEAIGLRPVRSQSDCYVGMMIFKTCSDNGELNARYKDGGAYYTGDLMDYYHVGVVTSVSPFQILHCTSNDDVSGFVIDTKLGKWNVGGAIADVDYEGGAEMTELYKVKVVTSGGILNIRQSANIKAKDIGDIPNGEEVSVLDDSIDEWLKIVYDGVIGYVKKEFTQRIDKASTEVNGWDTIEDLARKLADALRANGF